MFPIILGLALLIVNLLGQGGFITPFMAGAAGLAVSSTLDLPFNLALLTVVGLYMTAFLANSIPASQGLSMDTSAILGPEQSCKANPILCYVAKVGALLLFIFLPIGKPSGYIYGPYAVALISVLLAANKVHQRGKNSSYLLGCAAQILVCTAAVFLFNRYADAVNPVVGIISGSAVAGFLFPSRAPQESGNPEYLNFSPMQILSSLLLVWLTPGFSTSAVASSIFPPDQHRYVAISALEGAVEGWVVHLLLSSQLSGKSPLGDLLGLNFLDWSSFTANSSNSLFILLGVGLALLVATFSPGMPVQASKPIMAGILVCQATIILGSWSWLFLISGLLCLYLRRRLFKAHEDSISVCLLAPLLLN